MAGLVSYDIYDDSSEESEQTNNEEKRPENVPAKNSMEEEWQDFENLIGEKAYKEGTSSDKTSAVSYPTSHCPRDSSVDRLKDVKFDVKNFTGHNENIRFDGDGTKIPVCNNSTEDQATKNNAGAPGQDDKGRERLRRKRSRSSSRSRRRKRSPSSSSSSSSRDSSHHHHHHHRHHKSKRRRSRSPHRHHRHHHRHGKRSRRSSSSSRSPPRWRGGRGGFSRGGMAARHKKMLMMNREVSMKNQVAMVANKAMEAMIAPTMKSGTKLPEVFGDMNVEELKEQLKGVYGKSLQQLNVDPSKLMTANEKKSALPLKDPLSTPSTISSTSTPQQVLSQTMAAMHAKVQELTGVAIPKYYNPAAVNPLKYAEQLKKRKLLWSKKSPPPAPVESTSTEERQCTTTTTPTATSSSSSSSSSKWVGTSFVADDGGKKSAKFNKLMGIKGAGGEGGGKEEKGGDEEKLKKQEELLTKLEQEYEAARHTTHSYRGVGLGFASHHMP